jgi:rRNA maturation protein Nop10
MILKRCPECKSYNLEEYCKKCKTKTNDAHYKFLKIRDAPKSDPEHFQR